MTTEAITETTEEEITETTSKTILNKEIPSALNSQVPLPTTEQTQSAADTRSATKEVCVRRDVSAALSCTDSWKEWETTITRFAVHAD